MGDKRFLRFAVLVASSVLALIGMGAYVTSLALAPQLDTRSGLDANVHRLAAIGVGSLALVLAVWLWRPRDGSYLGWIVLGFFILEGWAGWLGERLLHATLAPIVFAAFVVVLTTSNWNDPPEVVKDETPSKLRRLAFCAPPLVLLQTFLGATYRHQVTGFIPHLAGAMFVLATTLFSAAMVIERYPKHRALRSAAVWLISIVLAQVILGATAFALRLLQLGSPVALIVSATAHVILGSATLAASSVLALQVHRHVRGLDQARAEEQKAAIT